MKKAILILVVAAGTIAAVVVFNKQSVIAPGPSESPMVSVSVSVSPTDSVEPSPSASPTPSSQTITISFANGTATPSTVNIKVGDTVKFINNDSALRWPASGMHPTHQICPGFDSLRGLNTGENYSFTFNTAKTCPWHDHLKPAINGQIIISN